MFCEICGKKARDDALFCEACGNRLESPGEGGSTARLAGAATSGLDAGPHDKGLTSQEKGAEPGEASHGEISRPAGVADDLMQKAAEMPEPQKAAEKQQTQGRPGHQPAHPDRFAAGVLSGIVIALFIVLLAVGGASVLWWLNRQKPVSEQPSPALTASTEVTVTVMPTPYEQPGQSSPWSSPSGGSDVITPVFTDTPLQPPSETQEGSVPPPFPYGTPTAPVDEKVGIEAAVRQNAPIRVDYLAIEVKNDWAFVDACENDEQGRPNTATMILLRKIDGAWQILCHGDSFGEEWQKYVSQMPPDVKSAHDRWNAGHI